MTVQIHESVVPAGAGGLPLIDVVIQLWPHLDRSLARQVIQAGGCYVDDTRCRDERLNMSSGSRLKLVIDDRRPFREFGLTADAIAYEDRDLLVLLKPTGVPVDLSATGREGSLRAAAEEHLAGGESAHRPAVIHRLDRETTGLVLFGKNRAAERQLYDFFRDNRVRKEYLALVCPPPAEPEGTVHQPLTPVPGQHNRYQVVTRGGKSARTSYRTVSEDPATAVALLDVSPLTGRTHQIRVHLAWTGSPILGDTAYGGRPWAQGFGLHAWKLQLPHPRSGTLLNLTATPPATWTGAFPDLMSNLHR
jgi:23S rRNA pseudouridine1911/1915/1917 synthase